MIYRKGESKVSQQKWLFGATSAYALALLGRVNSLGAGMGFIIIALASLFFGWLINAISARIAILVCAILMGLIALGVWLFPFMKHLDENVGPEDVREPAKSEA